MNARPLPAADDPAQEILAGLPAWPDTALYSLARGLSAELLRRQRPLPAALPVVAVAYAALGMPDLFAPAG